MGKAPQPVADARPGVGVDRREATAVGATSVFFPFPVIIIISFVVIASSIVAIIVGICRVGWSDIILGGIIRALIVRDLVYIVAIVVPA